MAVVEFFVNVDEVWYSSDNGLQPLTPTSPVVEVMDERIKELFPKASEALDDIYAKSFPNTQLFRFKRVRRFCKCNFGTLDHTKEDVDNGVFHFERVSCPLRGECPYESVLCMPSMNTMLSDAEKRVMKLVCDGYSNAAIGSMLFLSPNTVKRHISTSYIKTRTKNRAEFVTYIKDNNISL